MNRLLLTYYIDCVSSEEQGDLKNYFESQGGTVRVLGRRLMIESKKYVEHELTCKRDAVEPAAECWKALAPLLKRDFTVDGTVCSGLSDDYSLIDIGIEYKDKAFTVRYSDCYEVCFMSDFDDYEEFCDLYGEVFSEEEFEEVREDDYFIVEEDGEGYFETEVTLKYTL